MKWANHMATSVLFPLFEKIVPYEMCFTLIVPLRLFTTQSRYDTFRYPYEQLNVDFGYFKMDNPSTYIQDYVRINVPL